MASKKTRAYKSKGKQKREIDKLVKETNDFYNELEDRIQKIDRDRSDYVEQVTKMFQKETEDLRENVSSAINAENEDEVLRRYLPRSYGLVKAASSFLWNKPHYDEQIIGGILLNDGYVSEMATGEGKTLTAALPAFLNALTGRSVHVITPNPYLAKRDYEEMSQLYRFLGLTCGLIEERPLKQEDIKEKVEALLEKELTGELESKSNIDKQKIIDEYMTSQASEKKQVYSRARSKAIEALRSEDLEKRRKAYQSDIVYASSNAIAFDYLYDGIENDVERRVQVHSDVDGFSNERYPGFAIVDEVDSILFDDAVTPFSLSGTNKDTEYAMKDEEKEEYRQKIVQASNAVSQIFNENKNLIARKKKSGKWESLILSVGRTDYETIVSRKAVDFDKYDMTKAVVIDKNDKQVYLTTLGEVILFKYYRSDKINKILRENKDLIIDSGYSEGLDYDILKSGNITMEPRALADLVVSGAIPSLTSLFNEFGLMELTNDDLEITNALQAWFILEENVDYKLTVPDKHKTDDERSVSLVLNGRTAEGRVYSRGLQQSLEQKEKIKKRGIYQIKPTKINDTLASIPASAFFDRYRKLGGMTGTSAISAFQSLYGLDTYEVPRHKPRQVIDHGEVMCVNTFIKNERIYQEVKKSYLKKQPVLLSTTSIDESKKLYEFLTSRFKEDGLDIPTIPVLNAEVDNLEEEADIISGAGKPGAITISTEMAGRGTDIKLGGETPDLATLVKQEEERIVRQTILMLEKKGQVTDLNRRRTESRIRERIDHNLVLSNAEKKQIDIERQRKNDEEVVTKAGGLKVIGSGHFAFSRVDDQVKGRCGRQGNVGEIIFFNDPKDLQKVWVPVKKVQTLLKSLNLPSEVASVVSNNANQNRSCLSKVKEEANYTSYLDDVLDLTIDNIVSKASNNNFELRDLTYNFLGFELNPDEINGKSMEEIKYLISYKSKENIERLKEKMSADAFEEKCHELSDKYLTNNINEFNNYMDLLHTYLKGLDSSEAIDLINDISDKCFNNNCINIVRDLLSSSNRDNFSRIMIGDKTIDDVIKDSRMEGGYYTENGDNTPVGDAIYEAQTLHESMVQDGIKQSQEVEVAVATYRNDLRVICDELKDRDDYIDAVCYFIETTVEDIIVASTSNKYDIRNKTKLSRIGLDKSYLRDTCLEFLGVDLTEEDIAKCKTAGDVKNLLVDKSYRKMDDVEDTLGSDELESNCKKITDTYLARSWYNFEDMVEYIKRQDELNRMAGLNTNGLVPSQITMAYEHSRNTEKVKIVREILNPNYKQKYGDNARDELYSIRVVDGIMTRVDNREIELQNKINTDMMEKGMKEARDENSVKKTRNLSIRSRLLELVNNATLLYKSKTGQLVPKEQTVRK